MRNFFRIFVPERKDIAPPCLMKELLDLVGFDINLPVTASAYSAHYRNDSGGYRGGGAWLQYSGT